MGKSIRYFVMGMGQLLDISGNYTQIRLNNLLKYTNDGESLRKDWEAVGTYLGNAINEQKKQQADHSAQ